LFKKIEGTMADIPVVITSAGAQPTPPAVLLANLLATVEGTSPGYTARLPGILIEDISSTDVGALVVCDTARIETLNSISPYSANDFLLAQQGQVYIGPGAAPAPPTNTSVSVVFTVVDAFSNPVPGYVIDRGFTVSDGTYQYVVQDGMVTGSNGITPAIFCAAILAGSWGIPTNTVTQIITSVPTGFAITCTNPLPGTSGGVAETNAQYRARVLQAGQAVSTGTTTLLKTLLGEVTGVQQRLISTVQQTGGGWEIIVGGGDPYAVAGAIFASGLDVSTLVGSTLAVTNITQHNPGVVTTNHNHDYSTGQVVTMTQIVGMTPLNGLAVTITVTGPKTFSIGVDTTGFPAYISGGVCSPVLRNVTPNIIDVPDIYTIPFVNPPQQSATMAVSWHTTASNFVSAAAVSQLAAPAIAAYVNAIMVGAPINLLQVNDIFLTAIASVLDASQVASITISVAINGISTSPSGGTQLVFGDPESFFETPVSGAGITVTQV
jgi:Ubiquitin-activating enzyme E1 FCCH domain/Baseplate J-like protein